ncbi:MAG: rhodanese-like domain-containing protein [Rubrivivax sp.]|nr:rhodanese-like domain-containing protein [Rubrivivax sp.]
MSFLLEGYNWVLVLMAITSGALLFAPMLQGASGGGISTAEAVRLINREKGVLIDVCEPDEYAAGHAGGARNLPLSQLQAAIDGGKGLPSNKTLPVILMCARGQRSARAAAQLRKAGWEKAVSVTGGNIAWREATLPIEKSA